MPLQEDINKSFGTSNYFDNKDQMRNEINDFIRNQRGKNSAQNAIARNLRRGLRARIGTAENNATGELVKTAKLLGIDDPLAGGGLGMEAGQARKFAEFTLNRNFEEERRKNQELEARTKGIPVAGQQNAGAQPVIGANSVLRPETVANAQQGQQKSILTKPDWAKDVENDRTFPKGFFDDAANLARIQGMSRAEVADMLNKARVARFMSGATARGNALKEEELTKSRLAEYDQIVQRQNEFNSQVDSKVNDALNQAGKSLVKKSIKLPDGGFVSGLSEADLQSIRNAQEIAKAMNNDNLNARFAQDIANENLMSAERGILATGELPPSDFYIDSKGLQKSRDQERQALVKKLNQELSMQARGFESPSANYYSMTTEEKLADFQRRNNESKSNQALDVFDPLGKKNKSDIPYQYVYKDGIVSVVPNKKYKSTEYKTYQNLSEQSGKYNSPLRTNARNQVISEAQAKQQREAQLTQQREQYRQQSIEQQRMIDAAYALFP